MDSDLAHALARLTLYLHFAVVVFNIGALIVIPLGKIFTWRFVRVLWWRALHAFSMALVAVQAALGQYCFLTLVQSALERAGQAPSKSFWLDEWISAAVYWPLPLEVFVPLYLAALGLTILFWIWVRPTAQYCASELE
jgi:hypothetical protein